MAVPAPAFFRVPVPPAGGPWSLRARCPGRAAPAPLRPALRYAAALAALRVGRPRAPLRPAPRAASPPASGGLVVVPHSGGRAGGPLRPLGGLRRGSPPGGSAGQLRPGGPRPAAGPSGPLGGMAAGRVRRAWGVLLVRPAALWVGAGAQMPPGGAHRSAAPPTRGLDGHSRPSFDSPKNVKYNHPKKLREGLSIGQFWGPSGRQNPYLDNIETPEAFFAGESWHKRVHTSKTIEAIYGLKKAPISGMM